jgi:hypothetical protein
MALDCIAEEKGGDPTAQCRANDAEVRAAIP